MVEHPATTLDDWTTRSPAERTMLVGRSRELAQATSATHGTWTSLAEPTGEEPAQGPLSGVAISVKDNIDVRGLATTAGSPLLASAPVEADAGAVSALRAAGAVVVGKTNMHELALGITSDNATHGPARNPADPARSAGGSSGGSAASVALGVVPVALGSDTGGSVTIPASFCGVVGYRPSTGRWPGDGMVTLSTTRDTVGVHAWSVADARRVDELVTHVPAPADTLAVAGLRLGLPRSRHADLDPEVARLTSDALAALEAAGAHLVEVDVADDVAVGAQAGTTLVFYEAPRLVRARLAAQGSLDATAPLADLAARVASPDVRALVELMAAQPVPAQEYTAARAARWRLQRDHAATFARWALDALVWPSVPVLPPLVGQNDSVVLNGRAVPVFATVTRNTGPGAVSGLPCVSVPAGRSAGGLPVGLSVEGRAHGDDHLLRVAAAVEDVLAPSAAGTAQAAPAPSL